jgi:hypothetical protein
MSDPHHWQNFPEASVSFPHFGQNIPSLLITNIKHDVLFNLTVLLWIWCDFHGFFEYCHHHKVSFHEKNRAEL